MPQRIADTRGGPAFPLARRPLQDALAGAVSALVLCAAAHAQDTSVSAGSDAALGPPFSTRHARFEPVAFSTLPGWNGDALRESLSALRQTCQALRRKPAWTGACQAADQLPGHDDAAMRDFFEKRFYAYSLLNPDNTDEGIITGYYEPLLEGSRARTAHFRYPVYGVPDDLLMLDARVAEAGARQWLRRDGKRLVSSAAGAPGAVEYDIALGGMVAGIRDKRYRVRVDADRVVPYWTRQQIEKRALETQVLAWVADAYALYSMQIQGSGRIRLRDGQTLRIAYGEQNGHPFLPQASGNDAADVGTAIKTRGLGLLGGDARAPGIAGIRTRSLAKQGSQDPEVARMIALLLGGGSAPPEPPRAQATRPAAPPPPPAGRPAPPPVRAADNPDVASIIAALSGNVADPGPSASPSPTPAARPARPAPAPAAARHDDAPVDPSAAGGTTGIPDPSYVFFRRIQDGPGGPLGALGVPLTAGRSIAVDPRTTPLGYPVFVSTGDADEPGAAQVNRLTFAQDTGGAIRGSVRADYFWGFGPNAGNRAASMKETGRMWLLMPRDQDIPATAAVRTRSAGGIAALPDCVVPDPDNCVED